jgi:hypothetical protein
MCFPRCPRHGILIAMIHCLDSRNETTAGRHKQDRFLWNGNNGWADAAGKRDALHDLREFRVLGILDKDRLIGFMVSRKGLEAVARLGKLVDGVLGE